MHGGVHHSRQAGRRDLGQPDVVGELVAPRVEEIAEHGELGGQVIWCAEQAHHVGHGHDAERVGVEAERCHSGDVLLQLGAKGCWVSATQRQLSSWGLLSTRDLQL